MILVDTSVLIDFFTGKQTISSGKFESILTKHIPFGITPDIIQEVLQGAKTNNEFETLREYLESQVIFYAPRAKNTYISAAKIYFDLRKKGLTVRSTTDCLIAQIAIEHDLFLLHNDKDYLTISKIAPIKFF